MHGSPTGHRGSAHDHGKVCDVHDHHPGGDPPTPAVIMHGSPTGTERCGPKACPRSPATELLRGDVTGCRQVTEEGQPADRHARQDVRAPAPRTVATKALARAGARYFGAITARPSM